MSSSTFAKLNPGGYSPPMRFLGGAAGAEAKDKAKAAFLRASAWRPADQAATASLSATASATRNSCAQAPVITSETPLVQKFVQPTTLAHRQARHNHAKIAHSSTASGVYIPAEPVSQQLRRPGCIPLPARDVLPGSTHYLPVSAGKGADPPPLVAKQGFKPPWSGNPTSAAHPTSSCSVHTTVEHPQAGKVSFPDAGAHSHS